MRIDAHVHVYPPEIEKNWKKIAETEPHFGTLCAGKAHKWGTVEDVVARMEVDRLDQAWVTGVAFRDPGLCRLCNDYVMDALRRYPGKIQGLAVVNPLARDFEKEIGRCRGAGFIGVGELLPYGQVFDISDSRETWRLAGACQERGMFLLLHVAEPVGRDYPGKGGMGPGQAAAFCENHPEVQVVFAHMGGGLWAYETMKCMKMILENAWYDTAAAPFLFDPAIFRAAVAAGAGGKILYGSDFPLLCADRYEKMFLSSGLGDDALSKIRGLNALSLLEKVRSLPGLE